jgi:hypothetical protein
MMSGESRTGEDVESSSHGLYHGTASPQFNIALNDTVLLRHGHVSVLGTWLRLILMLPVLAIGTILTARPLGILIHL